MQAKPFFCLPVIAFLFYTAGCANNNILPHNAGDTTSLPPVETKDPNSNYKPAFAGQTRIGGVKTTTPYQVEKIAEGLSNPWAITPMPDGRFLVTMRSGYMQIHNSSGALVKKITGFPEQVWRRATEESWYDKNIKAPTYRHHTYDNWF